MRIDANVKADDALFDDTPLALLRRATPPKLGGELYTLGGLRRRWFEL
jgi:hypothetical protein